MQPVAVMVSYRLGGADGVAVEARKWEWALHELGFRVRRVAGELDDGLRPDDAWLPFLAIDPVDGSTPDPGALGAALAGADLVVVENLCSLPINPDASTLTADVLAEHDGPVMFHHHDLPWQRAGLTAPDGIPPHRPNSLHVTVNDYSRIQLEHRGFEAVTLRNTFDLDPPRGDRDATRVAFEFADDDLVLLQPSRRSPARTFLPQSNSQPSSRPSKIAPCGFGSRAPRRTATTSCSRASSPRRQFRSPSAARSRHPTRTPPPTSSCTHRPGRASATP